MLEGTKKKRKQYSNSSVFPHNLQWISEHFLVFYPELYSIYCLIVLKITKNQIFK